MSRYKSNKIYRDSDGNRYKQSTVYGIIPYDNNDRYIEVGTFDRLDNISFKYYGNKDYWWIIAAANQIGKGTLAIKEGGILRLPANPEKVLNNINKSSY